MEGSGDRAKLIALAVFALIAAGVVVVILVVRGCGSGSSPSAEAGGCREVEAPPAKHVSYQAPPQTVKVGEKLTALVKTSCGSFEIALDTAHAPKTVNSFVFLSRKGFYDDLTFHRIVPGFVIQGGDPLGTGSGGPGYSVTEKPPKNLSYGKGVVAMAKGPADPAGRSGSQFFVVTGAKAPLPPEYALVGRVSRGMDVVERIGKLGTPAQKPTQTILIEKVTIEKG